MSAAPSGGYMAFDLKLPRPIGGDRESTGSANANTPITQARSSTDAQVYDPLASVSLVEQMRTAMAEAKLPRKVPLVGHLPIVRQFQVLGILLVTFLGIAAFIMYMDGRTVSQATA